MKKLLAILLALSMIVCFAACGDGSDEGTGTENSPLAAPEIEAFEVPDDFKIGFICLHDEMSTYDLNFLNGIDEIKEALDLEDSQVLVKKNIPETDDCYQAAKDLANEGCDIVFANSFGHESFMIKAAKEFPDVQFCHATGTQAHVENLPNYHNAFASIYEGRYLAGVVAGLKLKEMMEADSTVVPKMGYVGAFTYAEVISGYSSFYLGAKSIVPEVTMDVQFTGSWYDVVGEKNAAEALIARGCVLISQHADSMGAPSACEAAGVPNVSYNGSTYEDCPETFLISSRINWAPYYSYIIKCVVDGEAIAADWCGGITEGSVVLTDINTDAAAEGTKAKLEEVIAGLKDGSVKVFDTKNFTVGGNTVTSHMVEEKEVVENGIFMESKIMSAPYFDLKIDGITRLNEKF